MAKYYLFFKYNIYQLETLTAIAVGKGFCQSSVVTKVPLLSI